ncbi:MAG: hypothetical protein AAF768_08320 [Pseudomonadota bacterium]
MTPLASAETSERLTAFADGRYADAVALAQIEDSADSLAFAARSLLAEAMSAEDHIPSLALAEEAENFARRALGLDPRHVEARLQLAIALSLRARPMSTRQALDSGLGTEAKKLVLSVLDDDPDNFYAHGFMSVWHLEVVRRGGSLGSAMMGASVKKARRHYQHATALNPDDASTHWQYARALAALNARKYREEVQAALEAAYRATCETELETIMKARAVQLNLAFQAQSNREVERIAERML